MHRGSLSIDRGINAIYIIIRFILLYCKFLPTGSREEPKIILDDVHLVCYLRFTDGSLPEVYIFPATVWNSPNGVFTIHDYKRPEYGISGAKKYRKALEPYKAINFFEHLSQPHC